MTLTFRELQSQLQPAWGLEQGVTGEDVDLLMVPSLSVDPAELALIPGAHHYEERQLFCLMRLRHPGVRVVYVTSKLLPEGPHQPVQWCSRSSGLVGGISIT
jgi:hypothetical protein